MGIAISVMNQKGGVGKTTITSNLGVGLAALGYNVTLIDMDPQGHLGVIFDLEKQDGIFDLIVLEKSLEEVMKIVDPEVTNGILKRPSGTLALLPGNQRTQVAAVDLQVKGADFGALNEAISPIKDAYDFILFDTSPTVSLFTPAIIQASDYILIPTELSRLGFDGVEKIITTISNTQRLHNARIMGIIPTMYRANTREHQERTDELKESYDYLVWDDVSISQSVVWQEAADVALPIFKYDRNHKAAEQMWSVCNRVLQAVGVTA